MPIRARLRSLLSSVVVMAVIAEPSLVRADDASGGYRLGPGDVLQVTVVGQAELSGKFRVGPEGELSYPLVGGVAASGRTTAEVVADLTARLAQHVPVRSAPAVEIVEFAPVFVTGEVEKPGQYPFRPGMVAIELVALAGGDRRPVATYQTRALQLITAEQAVENRRLTLFANRVQRARLEAEIEKRDFTPDTTELMTGGAVNAEQAKKLTQNEADLFAVRKKVVLNQIASLRDQRASFDREIQTLRAGIKLHDGEIILLEQETANAQKLLDRSLGLLPTLLGLKRQLSSTRRDALELQSYLARAQQQQFEIDQKIQDIEDQQKKDNASALRDLDISTAQNVRGLDSDQLAVSEIRAQLGRDSTRPASVTYRVARIVNGVYADMAVDDFTRLAPRDILRAQRPGSSGAESVMQESEELAGDPTLATRARRDR